MKKILLIAAILFALLSAIQAQNIQGNYAIKNVKTGMLLRVKDAGNANGTPLVAYYPENWKCMTWNFKNTGNETYQLQNLLTGKTFQPGAAAGENVAFDEQPLKDGAGNQQYEFIKVKQDTYKIRLKGTELYVTPSDDKGKVNSAIVLNRENNQSDQLWYIYQ